MRLAVIVDLDPDVNPELLRAVIQLCLTVLHADDDLNTSLLAEHFDRGPKHAADFVNMTAGLVLAFLSVEGREDGYASTDRASLHYAHHRLVDMLEAIESGTGEPA